MEITEAPPRAELVRRATELVPLLREHALRGEELRKLPEETIEALTDAGVLRLRLPASHGGYEVDAHTLVDVISELATGDGATAWTVAVWSISSWVLGLFPDEVQDEIFATPDVRVSGILSPTAMAVPTEGGVVVNGKWAFNTGSQQSQWNTNAAIRITPDGGGEPVMLAIPISDLQLVDDWHTVGMRASGSVTSIAQDVFVPDNRVLPMGPVIAGIQGTTRNADHPMYRVPFMPVACAAVAANVLGLARAAQQAFFDRLPGRKITYTDYESQAEAPITHLQVATAAAKIDEATFHTYRVADQLDTKGASGAEWTLEERAKARLDLGATCRLAKEAVDILAGASGGSSIYDSVAIQRIERDVRVLNLHAILHPDTNLELYGRILCGLEPNTVYI